jgi:hypothetical protein
MTDPDLQQLLDEFRSLPENERTFERAFQKLQERGTSINFQQLKCFLDDIIAKDLVSSGDIQAAATFLEVMVGFSHDWPGNYRLYELFDKFASSVTSHLAFHPGIDDDLRINRNLAAVYMYVAKINSYLESEREARLDRFQFPW